MKIEAKHIAKPTCTFEAAYPIELAVGTTQVLNLTVEEARELVRSLQSAIDSTESVWP